MKPFVAALASALTATLMLSEAAWGETLDNTPPQDVSAAKADVKSASLQDAGERDTSTERRQAVRVVLPSPYARQK